MLYIRRISSILTSLAFLLQSSSLPALAAGAQSKPSAEDGVPAYPQAQKDAVQHQCDELAESPADSTKVGPGVPFEQINPSEALPVCEEAATRQAWRSRYQFQYGRVLEAARRYADAARQYSLAAQGGQPLAAANLGQLYEKGLGVPKDWDEAASWYRKAGDGGIVEAYAELGMLYLDSQTPDYLEAAKWLVKAEQGGSVWGAFNLGRLYEFGKGVQKDSALAARLYEYGAKQGDSEAMYRLGLMYEDGEGVAKNYGTAANWLYQAGKQGNARAQEELAFLFAGGLGVPRDLRAAFSWFLPAAEAGLVECQAAVATMYDDGDVVARNPAEAFKWYREAAAQNDVFSMYHVGLRLRLGDGVTWNEPVAMQWFQKAADKGYAPAQYSVGYGYLHGLGGGLQDYRQAADWIEKAARQGDGNAQIELGLLYENGWGVDQDYRQAKALFLSASRSDNPKLAEFGRKFAENVPSPSENTPTSSSGKTPDWVAPVAIGVGILGLLYFFSGSGGHERADTRPAGNPPSLPGIEMPGPETSSAPAPRTPVCRQVPVETSSSTSNGSCLTSPTSCGMSGATTLQCD